MNNDKQLMGKILVGGTLGLALAALLISTGETKRRHEAAVAARGSNGRGQYGGLRGR